MNSTQSGAVAYLLNMVRPLVSTPDQVLIEETRDDRGLLLTLSVARQDMARIIGKQGSTATSIRTLLRQYGGSINTAVSLKIPEPDRSVKAQ